MTRWERIKHRLGVHGEAEWLDGRVWATGWYRHTYYCSQCNVIFHEGNVNWETRQSRLSLSQLRAERDAERERIQAYFAHRTKEFESFRTQQNEADDIAFGNINKLLTILQNDKTKA